MGAIANASESEVTKMTKTQTTKVLELDQPGPHRVVEVVSAVVVVSEVVVIEVVAVDSVVEEVVVAVVKGDLVSGAEVIGDRIMWRMDEIYFHVEILLILQIRQGKFLQEKNMFF